MSVFLIVLRLEVADDAQNTPDLSYNAPHFALPLSEKKSYAEVVEKVPKPLKAHLQLFRGRRESRPLTIEIFTTEEVAMDETLIDSVKSPSQDDSGEPLDSISPRPSSRADSTEQPSSSVSSSPRSLDSAERDSLSPHRGDDNLGATAGSPTPAGQNKKRALKPRDRALIATVSQDGVDGEGPGSSRPGSGKTKTKDQAGNNTIRFFSGNPAVEKTEGIIHLYKNDHLVSLTEDVPRSTMICMLTVPAAMTSQDLLLFIAPVEPWLEHIKIIRDGTPNLYMVLVTFKSQKYADDFYKNFNNIAFNSIESDICHLAYVAKVETQKAAEGAALPIAGLTELPVCPVCLERMDDSVDGILTILCNHSFHGSCLAQWGDTTCPVCRYVQTPEAVTDNHCFRCDASENLWICLVCGHVGCGRYGGGHAESHFLETNHTYSMELGNNRVWDYVGDNYVHRLVQNKGDGKLVEVNEGGHAVEGEKLDSITLEYTYLLTSQLEAQRHHFEDKIQRVEKEAQSRVEELDVRSKKAIEQCTKLEHQLSSSQKEKQCIEKKYSTLNTKLTKLGSELVEEQEMNKCLRQNQSVWQNSVSDLEKRLGAKDKEMSELQDQLRDIMFYVEAQQKLSNTTAVSQAEIQDGQIIVQDVATGGATGKRGRKKGGGK